MDNFDIHSIFLHKNTPETEICNIKKEMKKYRQLKGGTKFTNKSKGKFESLKEIKHGKNKIIIGKLKKGKGYTGDGIFDKIKSFFSPRLDSFNNMSQKTIKEFGDKQIQALLIGRHPIPSLISSALNTITSGLVKQKYGDLFHLYLVATIDGKNIIIEKQEDIEIRQLKPNEYKEDATQPVDLKGRQITLNQLLETARKAVGDKLFFSYDSYNNNCQYFVKYLLEKNGLLSEQNKNFLFQDLEELIKATPQWAKNLANTATNLGAVVAKIRGKGKRKLKGNGKAEQDADRMKALTILERIKHLIGNTSMYDEEFMLGIGKKRVAENINKENEEMHKLLLEIVRLHQKICNDIIKMNNEIHEKKAPNTPPRSPSPPSSPPPLPLQGSGKKSKIPNYNDAGFIDFCVKNKKKGKLSNSDILELHKKYTKK